MTLKAVQTLHSYMIKVQARLPSTDAAQAIWALRNLFQFLIRGSGKLTRCTERKASQEPIPVFDTHCNLLSFVVLS